MSKANETQIGGTHYKKGGEEHWDRAWRLEYDPFQYIITKWVERWRDKGGVEDLLKARHALDKYIEVVNHDHESVEIPRCSCRTYAMHCPVHDDGPTTAYVNQG